MYTYKGLGVKLIREGAPTLDKTAITCPKDAVMVVQESIGNEDREVFSVILLDTRNKVIGINTVAIGGLNFCAIHPREVFKPAIAASAASLILCHNHPSGDPAASSEDIELTKRLYRVGHIIGIPVIDHLIFTRGKNFSLKEEGHFPIAVRLTSEDNSS